VVADQAADVAPAGLVADQVVAVDVALAADVAPADLVVADQAAAADVAQADLAVNGVVVDLVARMKTQVSSSAS